MSLGTFTLHSAAPRGTCLLLHGMTGSTEEMKPLAQTLFERGYHVHVPLLTGHAAEPSALESVPASMWLEDVERALAVCTQQGTPICIIGLSFGALLGLYAATLSAQHVSALVLLSPPIALRSKWKDSILSALSYLPEWCVSRLRVNIPKAKRASGCWVLPYHPLPMYPLASIIRVFKIRRLVQRRLHQVHCPVLIAFDDREHLVDPKSVNQLKARLRSAQVHERNFSGGQHELVVGPLYREVLEAITRFLDAQVIS